MAIVKVSKKGWVVIPHDIRERHGIRPGDRVHIIDYGGQISLVPAFKDPIRQMHGMFKGGPSMTEGLLEDRRWEREREERKYEEWVNRAKEKSTRDG
jgi:AbrB family looped-hinge helix DNA binding protein